MSLLRLYCKENLNISYLDFHKIPLEERMAISETFGYQLNLDVIKLRKAWVELSDSIFDSIENKFFKWLFKLKNKK